MVSSKSSDFLATLTNSTKTLKKDPNEIKLGKDNIPSAKRLSDKFDTKPKNPAGQTKVTDYKDYLKTGKVKKDNSS